jgi:hypothetical protein
MMTRSRSRRKIKAKRKKREPAARAAATSQPYTTAAADDDDDDDASPRSSVQRVCAHVPQKSVLLPQATTRSQPQVVDCEMSVVEQA